MEGNDTWDSFSGICMGRHEMTSRAMVCVNYSPHDSQCFVPLPFPDLAGKSVRFKDLMSAARYDRDGSDFLE